MIVRFELSTKDNADLAVLGFLFKHLIIDETAAPTGDEPPATEPPKKKGRGPAKKKKEPTGPTEAEIKEFDFEQMSSHLLHKDEDPNDFEVRWIAKLFKKKHGQQDDIRAILNDMGSRNFTDLKKKDFKKFCTLLTEKDAALTTESQEDDLNI